MSSYQQSSKYKLVVSEFGSSFQVAIEDTTQSGTAIQDDIDNFELYFLTEVTGFTVSANKNHAFISDGENHLLVILSGFIGIFMKLLMVP